MRSGTRECSGTADEVVPLFSLLPWPSVMANGASKKMRTGVVGTPRQ
jgi:hypothetical protein